MLLRVCSGDAWDDESDMEKVGCADGWCIGRPIRYCVYGCEQILPEAIHGYARPCVPSVSVRHGCNSNLALV